MVSSCSLKILLMHPIDLDGIDPDEMTCREKKMLNAYHKMVWEKISPYLNDDEREWLKEYTREI